MPAGEQGKELYEFLERLRPHEGVAIQDMAELLDTTDGRINQLLAKIRQGKLPLPHQRSGQTYPPLNIHFDRMSGRYYNLTNPDRDSIQSGAPGEVLRTWVDDLLTRAKSLTRVYETQVDAAAAMKANQDAIALLAQLPTEQVIELVALTAELGHHQQRARQILREKRRQPTSVDGHGR